MKGMDNKKGDEYKYRKMFKKILLGKSKNLGLKNLKT